MEHTLSYLTTILYKDFLGYTSKKLEQFHLNYGSLPFILFVGKHPGCTPAQLTNTLHFDWGYSQRSITKLVQQEFITKEKSRLSGRGYQLNLTDKGKQAFEMSHHVFLSWDGEKMADLSLEEKDQLLTILKKLI